MVARLTEAPRMPESGTIKHKFDVKIILIYLLRFKYLILWQSNPV